MKNMVLHAFKCGVTVSEVMLRGKEHDKPDFAYNTLRIHSLMINTEMIEYNINGDTKAPLLRCFFYLKAQSFSYKNYWTGHVLLDL